MFVLGYRDVVEMRMEVWIEVTINEVRELDMIGIMVRMRIRKMTKEEFSN